MASQNRTKQEPPQFTIKDAVFTVFNHKWKILLLTLLGLIGAFYYQKNLDKVYESQVKLLIRYVVERSGVDLYDSQSGANRGVITTEREILNSYDLAISVAEDMGAPALTEGNLNASVESAANVVAGGLQVDSHKDSNVVTLTYSNKNPELAKEVLNSVVENYFDKHLEIHRSGESFNFVRERLQEAGENLEKTEGKLKALIKNSEVVTYDETLSLLEEQLTIVTTNYLSAQTELAEQTAKVKAIEELYMLRGVPLDPVNLQENEVDSAVSESRGETKVVKVGTQVTIELQDLIQRSASLRQQKLQFLQKYTASNSKVRLIQRQLDETNAKRQAILEKYPELFRTTETVVTQTVNGEKVEPQPLPDLWGESAQLASYKAKVQLLKEQTASLETKFDNVSTIHSKIKKLEQQRDTESEILTMLSTRLEKAQVDEALDPSRIPNISVVQHPSQPTTSMDGSKKKVLLGIAGSGLMIGLGFAFVHDMFIDRRVRFVQDIKSKMRLPVIMEIPLINSKDVKKVTAEERQRKLEFDDKGSDGSLSPIDYEKHFISRYTNAIRDRLFYYFESQECKLKPKLIAVTSQTDKAGASTVAAGLAASFKADSDANVLLVDMNTMKATEFIGTSKSDIETAKEGLTYTRRVTLKSALVNSSTGEGNNYIQAEELHKDSDSIAPRKLFKMMPKFRDSDFDYIIFDMPVMNSTSPTVAMAGIMDHVLLVLDAQNTDRDELKTNYKELKAGRAEVSCVYNKANTKAPKWFN